MNNIFKLFTILWLSTFVLQAQDITNKLGGNTAAETYDITDSGDNVLMRVQGDNGVLFNGTFGTGTIPIEGASTRLMWYPAKGAFRVGFVDGAQWDDANIGNYSTAMGNNTTASGDYSTAIGRGTIASGNHSFAMGRDIEASGDYTVAIDLGQYGANVTQANTMAIMGGNVGIGTIAPDATLDVHGTVKVFGDWDLDAYYVDVAYQATTDGFIIARISKEIDWPWVRIIGYTDSSNPPTTEVIREINGGVLDTGATASITLPVKKGDYFLITDGNTGDNTLDFRINWIPLGQ